MKSLFLDMSYICVIIPVHKSILNEYEKKSLEQCYKVLKEYDIYLVCPIELNVIEYIKIVPTLNIKTVSKEWLQSVENYNSMKKTLEFYQLFFEYDYMLTYELDSYIFSNNWGIANCSSYDYIGAPWFSNYKDVGMPIKVGNSGFSIRKISTCIEILFLRKQFYSKWNWIKRKKIEKFFKVSFLFWILDRRWNISSNNYYLSIFFSDVHINEDVFWCEIASRLFDFKVASVEDAIKFSFEQNPSLLFELNGYQLPIGCHAWSKYDIEFWSKFIDIV